MELSGIPSQAYGFWNKADATFGPPNVEDTRFVFKKKTQTIEINVD